MTTNLNEQNYQCFRYDLTERITPVFHNAPRWDTQAAPPEWFSASHHFVVDWYRETAQWLVQSTFCLAPSLDNNHYIVWIYNWEKLQMFRWFVPSHTVYPPVWDRGFGGLDYTDYVAIQEGVKNLMDKNGMTGFEVDRTLEGKFVHLTKETPDEVKRLLAEGKSYNILAIKAEAAYDKLTLKSVEKVL